MVRKPAIAEKRKMIAADRSPFQRRRMPQTPRSKETVDRILKAMQDLLEENSFSRVTTNHIAKRAGINIGSLYQYFSSRESIAFALLEQVSKQASATMRKKVLLHVEQDMDTAMPRMIRILLHIFQEKSSVLLRMVEQLPELREQKLSSDIRNLAVSIGRLYIEQRRPDLSPGKREIAYQFLTNSTIANIRSYLIGAPNYIPEQAFVRELSKNIVAYIRAA